MADYRVKGEQKLVECNCIKQSALQPGKHFNRAIRVEDSESCAGIDCTFGLELQATVK